MVTSKDLKDQILHHEDKSMLLCTVCGSEYSANKGDYWDTPDNHVFKCCHKPMRLVIKTTNYKEVI